MSGYQYHPVVRITPEDGSVRVFDLRSEMSDCSGQTETDVRYRPDQDEYEDVQRKERSIVFGLRCEVRLTFVIVTMADHKTLASIVNSLMARDEVVELSLNGGHVYRSVILDGDLRPRPLGGKTIVGFEQELRLRCVDLLDELPVMDAEGGW